jgi:hypothetical protein
VSGRRVVVAAKILINNIEAASPDDNFFAAKVDAFQGKQTSRP